MRKKEVYEVTYTNNLGEVDKICVLADISLADVIGKIAHHQSESQRHEEAMIDHNDKELALRDQLNEMLAKVGMKVVDVDTEQDELQTEHLVITDWRKLKVGDVILCRRDGTWLSEFINKECTVIAVEDEDYKGIFPIEVELDDGHSDWGLSFEFIGHPKRDGIIEADIKGANAPVTPESNAWPDYCDESWIIVDWDSVPEGVEVECVECDGTYEYHIGNVYKFGFDNSCDFGPIDHHGYTPNKLYRDRYKFRLIK